HREALAKRDGGLEAAVLVALARALGAQGATSQALVCIERAADEALSRGLDELAGEAMLVEAQLVASSGDGARARLKAAEAVSRLDAAVAAARAAGDIARACERQGDALAARDLLLALAARSPEDALPGSVREALAARREGARGASERALLETLGESARRLHAERDPARVVAAVLDAAIAATRAERGFVLLSPEEGEAP